ncbi:3-hexulose-6-phosphate synthase [Pyrobaculum islandicum DSM 4184]|uniref:3-hexulose-6-phosphate synthase n=1 Tax=Pyrobaculum islandicum (strain DSM 4184 / JCM 9189 / GEO3) TaxID=384616 RepID=A1RV55_PYRIL|nr:orotidine 5'-phosphate decarboxylase / HUMPS family protein [Pyrobaculum islandicum]ABL88837.1 3-hexulose-6-phosphate synthase [Pyrobaculum islandicum DSM 4184]
MKLQVALDLTDLRKAIELTRELCNVGLEIVEAGTPLIKLYGLSTVSALKAACPKAEVVADLKTADVGALEARLAKEFGADWATVLGATNIETIEDFIKEGRALGLKTAVDLIGLPNALERAREIMKTVTPDLFIFHVGVDVQRKTGLKFEDLLYSAYKLKTEGVGVGIAGGITEQEIRFIISSRKLVDVIIVGRAIVNDPLPLSKFITMNNILKQAKSESL